MGKILPSLIVISSLLVISTILLGSFIVTAGASSFSNKNLADGYEPLKFLSSNNQENEKDEEKLDIPITGTALEKASAIALAYIGNGRVTDTEIEDEEGYYEIEITLDNGQEVDVHLNRNFEILSKEFEYDEDD